MLKWLAGLWHKSWWGNISYQRSVDALSASPARQGEVFALDRESYIELHATHAWSQAKNQRLQKLRIEWEGAVVEVYCTTSKSKSVRENINQGPLEVQLVNKSWELPIPRVWKLDNFFNFDKIKQWNKFRSKVKRSCFEKNWNSYQLNPPPFSRLLGASALNLMSELPDTTLLHLSLPHSAQSIPDNQTTGHWDNCTSIQPDNQTTGKPDNHTTGQPE